MVAAVAVNLLIYALAAAIVDVLDRFTPLQPGSVIFLTVIGVVAAAGVCRLLNQRSARPVAAFRRIVPLRS